MRLVGTKVSFHIV